MDRKVTKLDVETQTIQKFIGNTLDTFNVKYVEYPKENNPCDLIYKGNQYQITEGDSDLLERRRSKTADGESYCKIRRIEPLTYTNGLLGKVLEKKKYKSNNEITLLVDCGSTGGYTLSAREEVFKKYLLDNPKLKASWQSIVCVFNDGNVRI